MPGDYFSHDQARSRAYRWGEDGIAGDLRRASAPVPGAGAVERRGPDPEGADVRPHQRRGQPRRGRQGVLVLPRQHADALVSQVPVQVSAAGVPLRRISSPPTRAAASRTSSTSCWTPGIFDEDRYFDVIVEYAKAAHDDILMLVTAHNRGPDAATLHLLPTLWFRNTWSWGDAVAQADACRPSPGARVPQRRAAHPELGEWRLLADASARAAVLRERDQQRAPVRRAERCAARQGRDQRPRRRRRGRRRQPGSAAGRSWPPTTCSRSRRASSASVRLRLTAAGASVERRRAARRGLRPRAGGAARGGRPVLRDGHPRHAASGRGDR